MLCEWRAIYWEQFRATVLLELDWITCVHKLQLQWQRQSIRVRNTTYTNNAIFNIISCLHIEAFVIDKKCPKYPLFARMWSLLSPWDDDEDDDKEEEDRSHLFEHLPLYFMSDSTHVEQNFSAQEFTHQSNKRSCEIFVPTYLVLVTFVWWKGQEPERRKRMSIAAAVGVKMWKVKKETLSKTIFYELTKSLKNRRF